MNRSHIHLLHLLGKSSLTLIIAVTTLAPGCHDERPAFVKPDAPVGACVLSYNTAFVDPGADACCAWVGGPNTCDAAVACNDRSGANCCLIYATDATLGGMGCCLYANGSTPHTGPGADRTTECGGLLAGP